MPIAHRLATALLIATLPVLALGSTVVDRLFDGDFNDDAGGSTIVVHPDCPADPCNSSSTFGSDANGTYWQWESTESRGGGFTLRTNAELGDTFTIRLVFSFDVLGGYRKIIDFKNRTSDYGLYFQGDSINFYPVAASSQSFSAGERLDLLITRNGADDEFLIYLIDSDKVVVLVDTVDSFDYGVPLTDSGESVLGFFHDDMSTSSEAPPGGKIYSLQILDTFIDPVIFNSRFED